tara:strand:- start:1614 stop:1847 length:234 start_codon:yes stop_codon:yes gene_type:complete
MKATTKMPLENLIGLIDDISTYIPEGKYIEIMNELKKENKKIKKVNKKNDELESKLVNSKLKMFLLKDEIKECKKRK